jgi:hypothetical protein
VRLCEHERHQMCSYTDTLIDDSLLEGGDGVTTSTRAHQRKTRCFVASSRVTAYPSRPFLFRNYIHDTVHNASSYYDGGARFRGERVCVCCRSTTNPHCTVWEACRATSAAPMYLLPVRIDGETYCDGGCVSDVCGHCIDAFMRSMLLNNPAAAALHEAGRIWYVCTFATAFDDDDLNARQGSRLCRCARQCGHRQRRDRRAPARDQR